MSLEERLRDFTRVYLDSSPVIYLVEEHSKHIHGLLSLFERLNQESLIGVTSPITLAECLIYPLRQAQPGIRQSFHDVITGGRGVQFQSIHASTAIRAAEIRATYGMALLDALHAAVAFETDCDAIITNDRHFNRLPNIEVIMLDDVV